MNWLQIITSEQKLEKFRSSLNRFDSTSCLNKAWVKRSSVQFSCRSFRSFLFLLTASFNRVLCKLLFLIITGLMVTGLSIDLFRQLVLSFCRVRWRSHRWISLCCNFCWAASCLDSSCASWSAERSRLFADVWMRTSGSWMGLRQDLNWETIIVILYSSRLNW